MGATAGSAYRYPLSVITLHWAMALLILTAIGMGYIMVDLPQGELRAWFFRHHKNIGLTVAILLVFRLAWRLRNEPPALPGSAPWYEHRLANATHVLLYLLMVMLPVTGFFATSFTGYPTYYIGIPLDLGGWAERNESVNAFFGGLHTYLAYTLLALVLAHTAGALRHLVALRDGVFERMAPWRPRSIRSE